MALVDDAPTTAPPPAEDGGSSRVWRSIWCTHFCAGIFAGYHVMLIGLKQDLAVGDTIPVTLTFEHSGDVDVTATVREG